MKIIPLTIRADLAEESLDEALKQLQQQEPLGVVVLMTGTKLSFTGSVLADNRKEFPLIIYCLNREFVDEKWLVIGNNFAVESE